MAAIKALEARFAAAFNAKDVHRIMKVYVPDGQACTSSTWCRHARDVGASAYRKDWEGFFAIFKGAVKFEISELSVTADRTLGYGHSIQHFTGTDTKGAPIDMTVRVTDVDRKVGGNWLVQHEHVSIPVDLDTGKPDFASKPYASDRPGGVITANGTPHDPWLGRRLTGGSERASRQRKSRPGEMSVPSA